VLRLVTCLYADEPVEQAAIVSNLITEREF
jgi:hypothetical protein